MKESTRHRRTAKSRTSRQKPSVFRKSYGFNLRFPKSSSSEEAKPDTEPSAKVFMLFLGKDEKERPIYMSEDEKRVVLLGKDEVLDSAEWKAYYFNGQVAANADMDELSRLVEEATHEKWVMRDGLHWKSDPQRRTITWLTRTSQKDARPVTKS